MSQDRTRKTSLPAGRGSDLGALTLNAIYLTAMPPNYRLRRQLETLDTEPVE
jgi:hypothetical protein